MPSWHVMNVTSLAPLAFAASLLACSAPGEGATPTGGRVTDSAAGTVALGIDRNTTYTPVAAVVTAGAIAGSVSLKGEVRDSVVPVLQDPKVCGDTATVIAAGTGGSSLANVLVWIDGIRSGKPLPEVRRQTLTIEHCRLEPRILAVVATSTINVFSKDRATHEIRFYREGVSAPIEAIRTVDEGQVVPSEKIAAESGIVEIRCSEHPFVRGYVAVFDHPYFAVTNERGEFTIDGLPPGTYTVKMWHERLAMPVAQRVVVQPSGTARLDASLALR